MNFIKEQLKTFIDSNLNEFKRLETVSIEECCIDYETSFNSKELFAKKSSNIEDYINKHEQYSKFQTILFKHIDNKDLKDSDVYNKVHIDRRLFSKIRSDINYHPSKETIILLAIALELNEQELEELLNSAAYSLPKNNNYDLIIRFCFINKIFKLTDINELLSEYNCKLFSY